MRSAIRLGIKIVCYLWIASEVSFVYAQQSAVNNSPPQAISPLMSDESIQVGDSNISAATQHSAVCDPWEKINRKTFAFNDALDTHMLVPVAKIYNKIMPKPLSKGIYNIFSNLNNFPTISNDILQGNFYQATSDTWRFIINSTAGIGGLFDAAENVGLENNSEDFGLTLARWGYKNSNYLVLPFFGPSTLRDSFGMPVDYLLFNPYDWTITNMRARYTIYALGIVSKRAQLLQYQNFYNQFALDRYTFVRNAYMQQRRNAIERNQQLSDPYFSITDRPRH